MDKQRRETLARQLEEIIGGVNGTTRSIEDGAECLDVLWRLQMLRAALNEAKTELMKDYLERWAAALVQDNNPDQCKNLIKEFPILFDFAGRKSTAVINHTRRIKMATVNYFIPSINCGNCKHRIETWLSDVEGIQFVQVNVPTKQATISFSAPATEESIKALLARVNYAVQEN